MDIGEFIKSRRQELGLTQEDIAKACDVHKSSVCMWEKGRIQNMKRDKLQKLANVLNVSPVTLIREGYIEEEPEEDTDARILFRLAQNANPKAVKAAIAMLKSFQDGADE